MVSSMFIDYINLHKKRALFIDVGKYSNILKLKYLDYNYNLLDYCFTKSISIRCGALIKNIRKYSNS